MKNWQKFIVFLLIFSLSGIGNVLFFPKITYGQNPGTSEATSEGEGTEEESDVEITYSSITELPPGVYLSDLVINATPQKTTEGKIDKYKVECTWEIELAGEDNFLKTYQIDVCRANTSVCYISEKLSTSTLPNSYSFFLNDLDEKNEYIVKITAIDKDNNRSQISKIFNVEGQKEVSSYPASIFVEKIKKENFYDIKFQVNFSVGIYDDLSKPVYLVWFEDKEWAKETLLGKNYINLLKEIEDSSLQVEIEGKGKIMGQKQIDLDESMRGETHIFTIEEKGVKPDTDFVCFVLRIVGNKPSFGYNGASVIEKKDIEILSQLITFRSSEEPDDLATQLKRKLSHLCYDAETDEIRAFLALRNINEKLSEINRQLAINRSKSYYSLARRRLVNFEYELTKGATNIFNTLLPLTPYGFNSYYFKARLETSLPSMIWKGLTGALEQDYGYRFLGPAVQISGALAEFIWYMVKQKKGLSAIKEIVSEVNGKIKTFLKEKVEGTLRDLITFTAYSAAALGDANLLYAEAKQMQKDNMPGGKTLEIIARNNMEYRSKELEILAIITSVFGGIAVGVGANINKAISSAVSKTVEGLATEVPISSPTLRANLLDLQSLTANTMSIISGLRELSTSKSEEIQKEEMRRNQLASCLAAVQKYQNLTIAVDIYKEVMLYTAAHMIWPPRLSLDIYYAEKDNLIRELKMSTNPYARQMGEMLTNPPSKVSYYQRLFYNPKESEGLYKDIDDFFYYSPAETEETGSLTYAFQPPKKKLNLLGGIFKALGNVIKNIAYDILPKRNKKLYAQEDIFAEEPSFKWSKFLALQEPGHNPIDVYNTVIREYFQRIKGVESKSQYETLMEMVKNGVIPDMVCLEPEVFKGQKVVEVENNEPKINLDTIRYCNNWQIIRTNEEIQSLANEINNVIISQYTQGNQVSDTTFIQASINPSDVKEKIESITPIIPSPENQ